MRFGGDRDDPRGCRGQKPIEQQIRQQKGGEVIDRKGQFETVCRQPVFRRKEAGIVYEHINPVMSGQDLIGQPAHLGEP